MDPGSELGSFAGVEIGFLVAGVAIVPLDPFGFHGLQETGRGADSDPKIPVRRRETKFRGVLVPAEAVNGISGVRTN